MKEIISLLIVIFILGCAGKQTQETDKIKEYELDGSTRIERFRQTGHLKGKGEVRLASSAEQLTESQIKNLPKHGTWEEYAQKENYTTKEKYSVLQSKGEYKEGKRVGLWEYFYEDKSLFKEVNYTNGKKNGLEKKFSKDGKQIKESNYVDGLLQGKYWEKTKNGILEVEGEYVADKKAGTWKEYYPETGNPKMIANYLNGKRHGSFVSYYEDGKTKMAEGNYINGLEAGHWKYYYKNGNVQAEGDYKPILYDVKDKQKDTPLAKSSPKAMKVGTWKQYYKSGALFSIGPREGKPMGEWKFYYKGNQLAAKGVMLNDIMMKVGETFNRRGLLQTKGKFVHSIIKIDKENDAFSMSYKPSAPFIYFKDGKKYLQITNQKIGGKNLAYEYDEMENKIGEGPYEPMLGKKNGCWTIKGKKVYYVLGKVKKGILAKTAKCE